MVEPAATGGALAANPADRGSIGEVLVIFGITGDLARVMTFRSLYRLEQRGLLDCSIVGVAVDDWSLPQLVERARSSIATAGETIDPAVVERLTGRLSYVQGEFTDPFGHDLSSARALAAELHEYVDESQLHRIDHYLGKMGLESASAAMPHDVRRGITPSFR